MEKYITDERTGLKYELVGDYYFLAGDDEPEKRSIGIWGQRHLRYLKQHCKNVYAELLTSGKLNEYLADMNEQAEEMFSQLVKELAEKDDITEKLKTENQMLWVRRMNAVLETATEIVNNEIIYVFPNFFERESDSFTPDTGCRTYGYLLAKTGVKRGEQRHYHC